MIDLVDHIDGLDRVVGRLRDAGGAIDTAFKALPDTRSTSGRARRCWRTWWEFEPVSD
jgi:hypothetical protein